MGPKYTQKFIINKGGISVGGKNALFNKWYLTNWVVIWGKIKFYLYPTLCIIINSKCIKDLSIKK